jgi:hypothetical protein
VPSISGSLGKIGANATVFFLNTAANPDFNPNEVFISADANGNYTSPTLGAGTYLVIPAVLGLEFSPFSSSQTVASSNITGVNFSLGSYYTLQTGGGDTFGYSGALDVVNPSDWVLGMTPGGTASVIAENGFAQGTDSLTAIENWVGPGYTSPYTGDVWARIKILNAVGPDSSFVIELRTPASGQGSGVWMEWFTNGTLGAPTGAMDILNIAEQTAGLFLSDNVIEFNVGDVIVYVARGSNYYMFQNGVAIGAVSFAATEAGFTSFICDNNGDPGSDLTIQDFSTGPVINSSGPSSGSAATAGYGTDISADAEVTSRPAGEINSRRTSFIGTNRGSRFIG